MYQSTNACVQFWPLLACFLYFICYRGMLHVMPLGFSNSLTVSNEVYPRQRAFLCQGGVCERGRPADQHRALCVPRLSQPFRHLEEIANEQS